MNCDMHICVYTSDRSFAKLATNVKLVRPISTSRTPEKKKWEELPFNAVHGISEA